MNKEKYVYLILLYWHSYFETNGKRPKACLFRFTFSWNLVCVCLCFPDETHLALKKLEKYVAMNSICNLNKCLC